MLKKLLQLMFLLISIFLIILGIIPLTIGTGHIGAYALIITGIILFFIIILAKSLGNFFQKHLKLRKAIKLVFALGLSLFLTLNLAMLWCAYAMEPPEEENPTMIILGCKVNGSYPSLTLASRLKQGYAYLAANQEAICVVSGGLGQNNAYTESEVMKQWLINKNISPHRIIEENRSHNTLENLTFSNEIIGSKEGSNNSILIVTDNFHQLRSHIIAARQGVEKIYHKSSHAPYSLMPSYWVREYFALVQCIFKLY